MLMFGTLIIYNQMAHNKSCQFYISIFAFVHLKCLIVLVHAVQKQSHERHYCNSIVAKRYFKNYDEKHLHLTFHINELNLALH